MTSQKAGRKNAKGEEQTAQVNMPSLKNEEENCHFAEEITRPPAFQGREEPLNHTAMGLGLETKGYFVPRKYEAEKSLLRASVQWDTGAYQ